MTGLLAVYDFDWGIFLRSVFAPDGLILGGLYLTIVIAIAAQSIGVILGILAALARSSRRGLLRAVARFYIWLFRGTPVLVQLALVYFGLSVSGIYRWPALTISDISVEGAIQAGIVTLGLNEGAYMAEIVRAGILAIDRGQMEAARSLGMTYGLAMRRIVLPQAARVIIPPLGNEFNSMLKTTSLLFALGVLELYAVFVNKNGSGSTSFHPFELFLAAGVWYLLLTTLWGLVQVRLERRFARGTGVVEAPGVALSTRLLGILGRAR